VARFFLPDCGVAPEPPVFVSISGGFNIFRFVLFLEFRYIWFMLSIGQFRRKGALPVILFLIIAFAGCKSYTVSRKDFEQGLRSRQGSSEGLPVTSLHYKQFKNKLDTLIIADQSGRMKKKRLTQDSKIRIYTKRNKSIKYYAKTLYIYKDEFLIGERTAPKLYGPNYFPVKLKDIDRIEVITY
jgi:hypothetical protein